MGIMSLLVFLFIGTVAGWLAGLVVAGGGFGFVRNAVVGIVGAFVAGLILPAVGLVFGGGILSAILHATIGAIIFLVILGFLRRAA